MQRTPPRMLLLLAALTLIAAACSSDTATTQPTTTPAPETTTTSEPPALPVDDASEGEAAPSDGAGEVDADNRPTIERVDPFDFEIEIGGVDFFAMILGGPDSFFDPSGGEYVATLFHEVFHRHQGQAFAEDFAGQDVEGCAYTPQNLELALLEERALKAALEAGGDTPEGATYAAQAAAIRQARLAVVVFDELGNRRMLDEDTARHLDAGGHHAIAVIDLDRFKLVNDGHGHIVGDQLLQSIARGLEQVVASCDVAASTVVRQGGDEFLISLHDAHPIDLGRVRAALDELRQHAVTAPDGSAIPLAFSYGLVADTGRPDMLSLVRTADLAAYDDKAARRQRVPTVAAPIVLDTETAA